VETNEMIDKLNSLIRLDNDALASYNKVIEMIEEATLKTEVTRFRDDHKRHVSVLSELVKSYGGEAATEQKDIRGLFLGGATALQSIFGVEGALKSLHTGEIITNKNYSESVQWDVPEDVKIVLRDNYADEQRHIRFVETALRDKVWEKH
jgi:uncharacterized protein (TIGR02284 family)